MKPYYQDSAVTIYHGDCREILPGLSGAVVTDPPYGTGWMRGGGSVGEFIPRHETAAWDKWSTDWLPSGWVAVFAPLTREMDLRAALGPGHGCLWYRKTNPSPFGSALEFVGVRPAPLRDGEEWVGYNGDNELHPCQKPVDLMRWIIARAPSGETIIDPFAGSGTTLRAAKDLGRKAIGIEIEERYCEIAARRCAQEVMELNGPTRAHP